MVLVLAGLLVACSGGAKKSKPHTTTTTTAPPNVALTKGDVHVESAGPDTTIDDATQQAILGAAQRYVDAAVLSPLQQGRVGDGFDALFDAGVKNAATGPDRATLTDDGIGKATKPLDATASPVRIDGLADQGGKLLYLGTTFLLTVDTVTTDGPLRLFRNVELTFAPAFGKWFVTAYRVTVVRTAPNATTSSTARGGGTGGKP